MEPDGAIAIVGIACQFPGARDPADMHELMTARRSMFRPMAGAGQAALLDGWAAAGPAGDGTAGAGPAGDGTAGAGPAGDGTAGDGTAGDGTAGDGAAGDGAAPGMLAKLTAEVTALALAEARMRDIGAWRSGLLIASSVPELAETLRARTGIGTFPAVAPDGTTEPHRDSLQAIAAAARAVAAGELDVAIAGGAELGVDAGWLAERAAAGDLADAELRVYDAQPSGLCPGDGCGVVVLMRREQARAAGLPVYAELIGWTTADGTPELGAAYAAAGCSPASVALIAGLGAGTAVSDDAELTALTRLRKGTERPAALIAASASFGYSRGAAGAASLIAAITAMVTGVIPPGPLPRHPHPLLASAGATLRLPAATEPWHDRVRIAAVNSLDLSARNWAHVLLRREQDGGESSRGRRRRAAASDGPIPAARPAARPAAGPHPAADARPATGGSPHSWQRADAMEREGPPAVFALGGAEPAAMAATLDVIAGSAGTLASTGLGGLARHLAAAAAHAADRGAPLRVAVTAGSPARLAAHARRAADLLRMGAAAPSVLIEPGISISAAAAGRIVLVFPGLAATPGEHAAMLASSVSAIRLLDRLAVRAVSAVGYSLGEIAGLIWAGCLSPAEGARLTGLRGQVLRSCARHPSAMARVGADAARARLFCQAEGLHFAACESPGTHILAGPAIGIRGMAHRAAAAGIAVEILPVSGALHTPAARRCAAPLRGVLATTRFAPPGRPLISTVTGQRVTAVDDIAGLLIAQLTRPVLFAQAIAAAARQADLILVAGSVPSLAAAAQASGTPAVPLPGPGAAAMPPASVLAALYAAGALKDLTPVLDAAHPAPVNQSWAVPAMREATQDVTVARAGKHSRYDLSRG